MNNRIAFRMNLKPGAAAEYRRRHDEIWPELVTAMRGAGILDYVIWHDAETDILFATMTIRDEEQLRTMRESEVTRKWWAHMSDLMDIRPDGSPQSVPLTEMFRLPPSRV